MAEVATVEQALLAEIETQKAALGDAEPRLRAVRLQAMRDFTAAGLPTRQDEAWRWTDLRALRDARPGAPRALGDSGEARGPFAAFDAWGLKFENGVFHAAQSSLADLPVGVRVGSLRAALQNDTALIDCIANAGHSVFLTLNTALLNDGAFIRIEPKLRLNKPLHLMFFNTGASQARNLILLGDGAAAVVLESHYGPDGADYFVNQASEVQLGEGARLAHYRDQAESAGALHFSYLNARLAARSAYDGFTVTRGARLSRNEAHVEIAGRDAGCNLNGVYMLNGAQTADTTTVIGHAAPGGRSRQMFRGALDGQSRGIFQGRIAVLKAAQHTDAQQQIKALLLSPEAGQNSKPELEILADDVKCAHGASVGQLDEAALFYLRSRGIAEAPARAMLIGAFLDEAVSQIADEPVRQALRKVIETWLAQQAVKND